MENLGLKKLEYAMSRGQLKEYLISETMYRARSDLSFKVMNNFYAITYTLNLYGENHLGFEDLLKKTIIQILEENDVLNIYSVVNIIHQQIIFEEKGKNKIKLIDEMLLVHLKNAISRKKAELECIFEYDGSLYSNGLYGVFEYLDNDLFIRTGVRFL